ncbi:MAG: hypothetical protein K2J25_00430 [Oscillospiraceae bacterium]|nr:hypothetical protein [Oscillospiraceae bacterium]
MDEYIELLGNIRNKKDFLYFMELFGKNIKNISIQDYLECISSWVESMEGYYKNTNQEMPKNINWDFIATLFYVGSIYE